MPTQDRAIRTRRTILEAAARVFESRGYRAATISEILAAAGVTKGALYFHFESKEALALGVRGEQDRKLTVPARAVKVQEFVDAMALHAHLLRTDPMVRAGARLTLDQRAEDPDRAAVFLRRQQAGERLLRLAERQGELLPHVDPAGTARVATGAFAGVQAMSEATTGYQDLPCQVTALLRHLLPNVVVPAVLVCVDLAETRGPSVHAEIVGAPRESAPADFRPGP
ncbi:ScbR family autoregulator-binding transcription factor [Streptomyces ziwulingensis]|uniref:ScbR family autoregulator-binding transcription factor n=1 Tax=Streptomyces ziwulingensis TaxID=1045501 RepID=A0ABP9BUQ0_9ACTN